MKDISDRSKVALAGVFFFAVTALIYFRAIGGGFIWDDRSFIVNNPLLHSSSALSQIWFSKKSADYWPLSYTLFWLESHMFGLRPLGYHLINIAVHALACVLLWRLLLRLRLPLAFFAALLFCVHPVNVESVAWIFQTKTTLAAALIFASTLFYLRHLDGLGRMNYTASIALFLLANLAKISGVTWPFVLWGIEWHRGSGNPKENARRLAPFFAVSVALGLLNLFWYVDPTTLARHDAINEIGLLSRLAGAGQILWFYLAKALVPLHLSFIYPKWSVDPAVFTEWLPLLLTGAVLALCAVCWQRTWARILSLTLLFAIVSSFPVLGFFDTDFMWYSWVADHYFYLSLAGVCAALALFVSLVAKNPAFRTILLASMSFACVFLSARRAAAYSSQEALWVDTIKKNPNAWIAHFGLGLVDSQAGKTSDAIREYREALKLNPDYAEAHNNLANDLVKEGRIDEAIRHYNEALRIFPEYEDARRNLSTIEGFHSHER